MRAGQPIALVGSSGGQGRPSLYSKFVVRVRRSIHSRGWEDKFCFNFVELFFRSQRTGAGCTGLCRQTRDCD
ncbi:hypothetical protein ACVXG7_13450 [Enterobacter hormaechei]